MRKLTISSEEIMSTAREYLRERGFDLTNSTLMLKIEYSGTKITNYEIEAVLPNEKPNLRVINGKL